MMIYSKSFMCSRIAAEEFCVVHLYPVSTPASLAPDAFKVMTTSCCPSLLRLEMCATAPGRRTMCVVWRCLLGIKSRQGLTHVEGSTSLPSPRFPHKQTPLLEGASLLKMTTKQCKMWKKRHRCPHDGRQSGG